jgi:hypothetical protein
VSTQLNETLSQSIPQNPSQYVSGLTTRLIDLTQGDLNHAKTNIKIVKQKLHRYLFEEELNDFESLYEHYLIEEGYISPALCFLTLLHLANEHHLQLVETTPSNFLIRAADVN